MTKAGPPHLPGGQSGGTVGDRGLERGRLKVSTDSMSTVYIEWKDIQRITSKELYVIEMQDGSRLQGTLAETDAEGQIFLSSPLV